MKKAISLLAVLGLAVVVVVSLPKEEEQRAKVMRHMYNSVLHEEGEVWAGLAESEAIAKPVVTPVKIAVSDTAGAVDGAVVGVPDGGEVTVEGVVYEEDRCGFPDLKGEDVNYSAQIVTIRKKFRYRLGEDFKVKVYVKNAGNVPWFSPDSKCPGARVYLGTARDQDRESEFYSPDIIMADNGWVAANRIRFDVGQMRVDPGEVASFTFWANSGDKSGVFREYFTPMIEEMKWMEEAEFKVDVYVGVTSETASELRTKLRYAYDSMRVNDINVSGERHIEIDLSDQRLFLKVGDYVVREFVVSSGKSETPTPKGTFKIMLKNEVRVGHDPPHYIMPRFQMFTHQGAGLHALPSLGTDGGVFWTEARNHIGRPVSHGCVRMLPEDADFTFEFTEVGDPIYIHF